MHPFLLFAELIQVAPAPSSGLSASATSIIGMIAVFVVGWLAHHFLGAKTPAVVPGGSAPPAPHPAVDAIDAKLKEIEDKYIKNPLVDQMAQNVTDQLMAAIKQELDDRGISAPTLLQTFLQAHQAAPPAAKP